MNAAVLCCKHLRGILQSVVFELEKKGNHQNASKYHLLDLPL